MCRAWRAETREPQRLLRGLKEIGGRGVCAGMGSKRLLAAHALQSGMRCEAAKLNQVATFEHSAMVRALAVDETRLFTGCWDGGVRIWSLKTGALLNHVKHTNAVTALALGREAIVSGSHDRTACVWSLQGERLHTLRGHQRQVMSVAIYRDWVVTGSLDHTACLWSKRTSEAVHWLKGHKSWVLSVGVNDDCVVTGSRDKTARIWSTKTGTLTHTLEHSGWVSVVDLNHDRLLTVSPGCVRKWSLATGALLNTFTYGEPDVSNGDGVAVGGNILVVGAQSASILKLGSTQPLQQLLPRDVSPTAYKVSVALWGDRVISTFNQAEPRKHIVCVWQAGQTD